MSHVSSEDLRKEIKEILKDADLTKLSAKKVRQKLQLKFKCDLTARKEEIDKMVLQSLNSNDDSKEEDEDDNSNASDDESTNDDSDSGDNQKKVPPKRNSSTVKKTTKRKANDSGSDENESEEEYSPRSKRAATAAANSRGKKNTNKSSGKKAGGKGKETGFTRAYTLSPELAALMGAESLPRHEVVKKMWAMIKERNLYDPKNKQYAICDNDLLKVIGVKRFRTFGMLKYLRPHFID